MKKVLFITPSFSKGGAEKNILNIINSLPNNRFKIYLIVCNNQTNYAKQLNKQIELIVLNKISVNKSIVPIINIIKKIKPQLVFTSATHLAMPIILYKLVTFANFKIITRIPSLPSNKLEKKGIKTKALSILNNQLLKKSDFLIAQTLEMKEEIHQYYGAKKEDIIFIPNIVDVQTIKKYALEYVELKKDAFYFVASGSLYSVKGFDILIKSFARVYSTSFDCKLIILGDETVEKGYKKYLEQLIKEHNLMDQVQLLGHQDNPYKYYQFADAFVLSSIKEGFPNVVLENLVLKKPVLVTDCINFDGIINDSNGIVVKKSSVESLASGLTQIRNFIPQKTELTLFNYADWFKKIIQ